MESFRSYLYIVGESTHEFRTLIGLLKKYTSNNVEHKQYFGDDLSTYIGIINNIEDYKIMFDFISLFSGSMRRNNIKYEFINKMT